MPELDTRKTTQKTTAPAAAPATTARDTTQDLAGNAFIVEQLQEAPGEAAPARGEPWREAYGDKLGGKAWGAIDEQLADEKLIGHAGTLVDTAVAKVREQLDGQIQPGDQEAYALFMAEMDKQLKGAASGAIGEGGLGEGARDLVEDHPYATGGAALAGAAAWVLSNQDIPLLETSKSFGEHQSLTAGIDPGRTMDLGLEQARLGWAYNGEATQAKAQGDWFGKDKGLEASGSLSHSLESGAVLSASGSHLNRADAAKTRADIGYTSPTTSAAAWWQKEGLVDPLQTTGASLSTTPTEENGIASHLSGERRSDGTWTASGGLSQQVDAARHWSLDGKVDQAEAGRSWEVQGSYERALDAQRALTLSGSHSSRPDEDRSRLDLGYTTPSLDAAAYLQRTRGASSVDTIGGSLTSKSDNPHDLSTYLRGEHSSDGAWTAAAGISKQVSADQSWGIEANAGRDAQGASNAAVMANWKMKF